MPDSNETDIWPDYVDKFAGVWKCVSYELFTGEGEDMKLHSRPHGLHPMGQSVVTRNGYLAAHMARPDRMELSDPKTPWATRGDAEIAHVARGISMYCGHMRLWKDEKGLIFSTTVEVASDPTRIGGQQARRVEHFEEEGVEYKVLRPVNPMVLEVSGKNPEVLFNRINEV